MRRVTHTLSFPEYLWLDFFRAFFAQKYLVLDDQNFELVNNFIYYENETNRPFDILLEQEMKSADPEILPSLIVEDTGVASLNISLNRLASWSVSPRTEKTRSDLLRATYIFHCCSRQRGESRLLAAIVASAITIFYDALLEDGLHKIEPWSIGKTTPVKTDNQETYVSTPVQVTFEYQQTWKTAEGGPTTVTRYCLRPRADILSAYIRASLDVGDARTISFINTSMNLEVANANIYVNLSADIADAQDEERYVLTSANFVTPPDAHGYVRTSMRVGG